ncbi:MAG: acyl-CoA/acyl-ACP dehydrogenase, partial [Spirochaetia bacterium]|nr:acyl-CoA/acyl-ACP dehydrogenase [Spirochaetia bacterium]
MDFNPSTEDLEFAESFRKFCTKEIEPHTAELDETGTLPRSHYTKLGDVGYLGLLHPRQFGGQEASLVQATLAQTILAEACGSTFFSAGASAGLFGLPILHFGTPEQKTKYLPGILRGTAIGALAVTEPDAGSDVSGLKSTAVGKNGEIILSGQKTYITNAPTCDYAIVLARYTDNGTEYGLTSFIVDMNK